MNIKLLKLLTLTLGIVFFAACGGGSSSDSGDSGGGAPKAPAGLSATPSNAQVGLSWAPSSGASSYNVYWGTSPGVTKASTKISGIATNSYTHTDVAATRSSYPSISYLTNGTIYYYKVSAVSGDGESGLSNETSGKPQVASPSAPANPSASAGNGEVTVSWAAVSGASSYNLYWATSSDVTNSSNRESGVTSPFTHSGRTNGTTYSYRIAAANAGGEGELSAIVSAKPAIPAPGAPENATVSAGYYEATISWDPVADATSYNIYFKKGDLATSGSSPPSVTMSSDRITGVTSPYTHTGLLGWTHYSWAVTAIGPGGESGLSATVSVIPWICFFCP
ncbi:hypothetical protein MNBD_NITROSPINAE02-2110 [hydrothermal vent metagenome]|uniref:Fibronectin type-III domain-containing protein n=1 Tax=hydrothermal vent metagenome TaxID=652676 RepID=A0A3B1C441_9ZZZZ